MKRFLLLTLSAVFLAAAISVSAQAADPPADRVVVMYFHRTQRCPTCKKMGSYSEQAVRTAFAEEIKSGRVEFHYVDFQKPENGALAKAYKISGPALVLAKVADNKVQEWKPLAKIWELVAQKDAFFKYVQKNVRKYLGK